MQKLSDFTAYETTYKEEIPRLERETGKKAVRLTGGRWEIRMVAGVTKARYVARDFNNDNRCEYLAAARAGLSTYTEWRKIS